jgi:hypothetical protein
VKSQLSLHLYLFLAATNLEFKITLIAMIDDPYEEEIFLREHGEAEKYLLAVSKAPDFLHKLKCLEFIKSYRYL